ncbi:hypothetical protein IEO21_05587 [Rhodonia placenta]|uniref:Uncharacterized protein n=1 Tax=Rhodonia placenta TaxID=104341 RepID=A0A8H7P1N1_9APHY|nr:hypothetical protein IEO21_05587 [Postia placenta]
MRRHARTYPRGAYGRACPSTCFGGSSSTGHAVRRRKAPALTSSLSEDFADFTEWCDVEAHAENLLILWEERALARDAQLSAAPPPDAARTP